MGKVLKGVCGKMLARAVGTVFNDCFEMCKLEGFLRKFDAFLLKCDKLFRLLERVGSELPFQWGTHLIFSRVFIF